MSTLDFLVAAAVASAAAPAWAGGDAVAGKAAFAPCASCHQVGPGARAGFGPQLNQLFGRTSGTTPDFAYSPAMRNAKIVWTEATLAAFIKDTDRMVPGNRMRFFSLGYGDRKLADLAAYLRTFSPPAGAAQAAPAAASSSPVRPPAR